MTTVLGFIDQNFEELRDPEKIARNNYIKKIKKNKLLAYFKEVTPANVRLP